MTTFAHHGADGPVEERGHRVVIVGCGFAGLSAAKRLRNAPVRVTVVDRTNHHLFQPLLYQTATGILSEGNIAPPIRDLLRRQQNASVILGEVVGIDPVRHELDVVAVGRRSKVPYDSLIVAAGASQSYFGNDKFARDAPGLKTIDDALEIRGRIFGAFELAEAEPDPDVRRALLTFVVVGAGPTGVELVGQIAELARRALRGNFRSIDPAQARVVLLDAAPHVMGPFSPSLQARTADYLGKLGVEIHLGAKVTGVDRTGIDIETVSPDLRRIQASTKIWAAGVSAAPLARLIAATTGAPVDRAGRIKVRPDCTVPGHPDVFVVGDLMSLDTLPGLAQVAMQSGRFAARTIAARVDGKQTVDSFHYRDRGTMATISRFRAVAKIGPLELSGFIGWCVWLVVHLVFLTGFKNRLSALANWSVAFVGRGRPQRTITEQQVFARTRLVPEVETATQPNAERSGR
jgi:NADH dehydrogenase